MASPEKKIGISPLFCEEDVPNLPRTAIGRGGVITKSLKDSLGCASVGMLLFLSYIAGMLPCMPGSPPIKRPTITAIWDVDLRSCTFGKGRLFFLNIFNSMPRRQRPCTTSAQPQENPRCCPLSPRIETRVT